MLAATRNADGRSPVHGAGPTTLVVPVTRTYREYPFEVFVEASGSPLETDSSSRLHQIRTVSAPERIHSVVGSLDGPRMAEVDEALQLSLGLD
ncbi:MazF family transcriptional regulator [Halorubrum kocurii JCM 14978]|uniref:MazF family transcriptional regulator n=1 Tax=Halorubrum kocurii JCM 14978 TaxID=1230456 RepID=M0P484_9EURY|nr:MazF family transcriptional regulator [Halorubrum kocurii JCM 14978]